jgi:RNA recognition motif-containing protein
MAEIGDDYVLITAANVVPVDSESTSIPKNPRTDRPVGYAFVDLSTPSEAERAIQELSGKEILERKVSVQLARKPEAAGDKTEGAASGGEGVSGGEGGRRRQSGRGRGRGRGRGGRAGRTGGRVSMLETKLRPCTDINNRRVTLQLTRSSFHSRISPTRLLLMLPGRLRLKPHALLVSVASAAHQLMAFHPRTRLWLPTSHTI